MERPAECHSAIKQIANLRYSRPNRRPASVLVVETHTRHRVRLHVVEFENVFQKFVFCGTLRSKSAFRPGAPKRHIFS